MKFLINILVFFISCQLSQAQTYDEWFRQNKTQKKYLLQQITALQVYIDYAAKGYSIATKGLSTIENIKHGDFNLHSDYFKSLSFVKPAIKHYAKVAAIISMQVSVAKKAQHFINTFKSSKQLTHAELSYLLQVFNNLLEDCA